MAVPGDIAERVLYEEVEVIRMVIRPIHRNDEFRLGIDLAVLGVRRHGEQSNEEEEGDYLQRLKQHHAERIERLFTRIETELIHDAGVPRPALRVSRSG